MNYKSFVFALALLLASTSCVYAQNKGKQVGKAVESAITKKAPAASGVRVPRVPKVAVPTPKAPATPRVPTVKTMAPTVAKAGPLPPPVSAAQLAERIRPAKGAEQLAEGMKPAPVAVPPQVPQAVPQFERVEAYGDNIIGLRQVVEEFAAANNRNARSDLRDIADAFHYTDRGLKETIAEGKYVDPASYPEVWLKTSKNLGPKQSLKRYTAPDSPLQPIFKLREQQLHDALNPGVATNPVELRFVLLDETTTRTAQEIEALVENLNVYDPLRSQIQEALGSAQKETGEGASSNAFLDIRRSFPNLEDEFVAFSTGGRELGDNRIRASFNDADEKLFSKQGNKVKLKDSNNRTSYVEVWEKTWGGVSIRKGRIPYMSAESPLQKAFALRQQQLDYLRSQEGNFLVDPSVGNKATMRVAQEIQGKLSNLPETNPLCMHLDREINWSQFVIEP